MSTEQVGGLLSAQDLRDAADACEVRADNLQDLISQHFGGGYERRGEALQPECDRYRSLTKKLRAAALRASHD